MEDYRAPLSRVRGLGAAKDGTRHWWMQRMTALALVPLVLWLAGSLLAIATADYMQARAWLHSPLNAIAMLAFIIAAVHHTQLGLQVVIEDYVGHEPLKVASIIVVKLGAALLALAGAFAVLEIALGG